MQEQRRNLPAGAGKSSFALIDAETLFELLQLGKGGSFLDIACGNGAYTLAAAERVEPGGRLYAIDLWEEGIASLRAAAAARGLENLQSFVGDATHKLPLDVGSIDMCFMASVLHDFVEIRGAEAVLRECARVIHAHGTLAVVEFKKIDGPPGPPRHIRLAPEEVESLVTPYGFKKERESEVGPYHYVMLFTTSA